MLLAVRKFCGNITFSFLLLQWRTGCIIIYAWQTVCNNSFFSYIILNLLWSSMPLSKPIMTVMFFATNSISQTLFSLGGLSDPVLLRDTQREFTVCQRKFKKERVAWLWISSCLWMWSWCLESCKNINMLIIRWMEHVRVLVILLNFQANTCLSISVQFTSVAQSCPTLYDPMDCSTPGFPVYHQLPGLA